MQLDNNNIATPPLPHSATSLSAFARLYLKAVAARYMRLTPCYLLVIVFYWKVQKFLGSGPNWDLSVGPNSYARQQCDKYWFTNFLYINNLYPFNAGGWVIMPIQYYLFIQYNKHTHSTDGCAGWTWYLGNDMLFFLLVPPLSVLFMRAQQSTSTTRSLFMYTPTCSLLLIQIATTLAVMLHFDDIRGSFDYHFSTYIYVKPWTRVSPYAIGMLLAFWIDDAQFTRSGIVPAWMKSRVVSPTTVGVAALSCMCAIIFGVYDQYECRAQPTSDCDVWGSMRLYGSLAAPNWENNYRFLKILYYTFTYIGWGLSVGGVLMWLFAGGGGSVRRALSHPCWTPLARLTYNAYLVHIVLIEIVYYRAPAPTYFSPWRYTLDALVFVVLAYVTSFMLFMVCEKPMMNVVAMLMRSGGKRGGGGVSEPLLAVSGGERE